MKTIKNWYTEILQSNNGFIYLNLLATQLQNQHCNLKFVSKLAKVDREKIYKSIALSFTYIYYICTAIPTKWASVFLVEKREYCNKYVFNNANMCL